MGEMKRLAWFDSHSLCPKRIPMAFRRPEDMSAIIGAALSVCNLCYPFKFRQLALTERVASPTRGCPDNGSRNCPKRPLKNVVRCGATFDHIQIERLFPFALVKCLLSFALWPTADSIS
jgi:hypothetical protein